MFINIILLIIFLVSLYVLWYKISELIPHLASIPDETINALLREESAKIRVFLLELKSFLREEKHKEAAKRLLHKNLQRTHVLILRLDNKIVGVLKKIRSENNSNAIIVSEPINVQEIKKETTPPAPGTKHQIMQEVRKRRGRPPGGGKYPSNNIAKPA